MSDDKQTRDHTAVHNQREEEQRELPELSIDELKEISGCGPDLEPP
jgi:hypothetical protein